MATIDYNPYPSTKHYTIVEAVNYMRELDKGPTLLKPIIWVDVRTGKRVSIG